MVGPTTLNLDVDVLFVFGPPGCFLFLFSVGVVCVGICIQKCSAGAQLAWAKATNKVPITHSFDLHFMTEGKATFGIQQYSYVSEIQHCMHTQTYTHYPMSRWVGGQ